MLGLYIQLVFLDPIFDPAGYAGMIALQTGHNILALSIMINSTGASKYDSWNVKPIMFIVNNILSLWPSPIPTAALEWFLKFKYMKGKMLIHTYPHEGSSSCEKANKSKGHLFLLAIPGNSNTSSFKCLKLTRLNLLFGLSNLPTSLNCMGIRNSSCREVFLTNKWEYHTIEYQFICFLLTLPFVPQCRPFFPPGEV